MRDTGGSVNRYYQPQQQSQQITSHSVSPAPKLKVVSSSLGFKLDEQALATKHVYIVKYVEPDTPSALAGLKEGDKITKINGKPTQSMPFDEFQREIFIAQQKQIEHNMIHLMVMRKSAKSTGTASYSATSSSSMNNLVSPIQSSSKYQQMASSSSNLHSHEKSSSFVDEGYVPGTTTSATSSTATAIGGNVGSLSTNNLVSVVKITSPTSQYGNVRHEILLL